MRSWLRVEGHECERCSFSVDGLKRMHKSEALKIEEEEEKEEEAALISLLSNLRQTHKAFIWLHFMDDCTQIYRGKGRMQTLHRVRATPAWMT